jgi:hypothetical protein
VVARKVEFLSHVIHMRDVQSRERGKSDIVALASSREKEQALQLSYWLEPRHNTIRMPVPLAHLTLAPRSLFHPS